MLLQGNLQRMFDVLYELGVIDPVLEKDWQVALEKRDAYATELNQAVSLVNSCNEVSTLKSALGSLAPAALEYLAMEVAREFAEYHARTSLH